jgi:integrase/recombinase XerC
MHPVPLAPVRLTTKELRELYEGFLRSMRTRPAETRGTYDRALREFLRWHLSDKRCRFLPGDMLRYRTHLTEVKQISAVSVSTYLTAVRRFCDYLVRRRVLVENPARRVGGSHRPSAHTRIALTGDEVRRVIEAVRPSDEMGLRDLSCIKLMVFCGLSEIELIRADLDDLRRTDNGCSRAVQGKGHSAKDSVVQVPRNVCDVLEQYLSVRGEALNDAALRIALSRGTVRKNGPLFASAGNRTRGARMTTRGVRERVNHYLEIAGVKQGRVRKITPFSLRHTAALMMVEAGASADEIKERMRLGSIMTALLYVQQSQHNGDAPPSTTPHTTKQPN